MKPNSSVPFFMICREMGNYKNSFFGRTGYGKKTFFDSFRKNAAFICSNPAGDGSDGLCSFYKLMLCTYFSKHRAAFQPAVSVQELVTKLLQEHPLVYHWMVSFTLFTFASVSQITDRMLSSVDQPKSVRGGRDMTLSTDCCQYFETQRHLFQCSCRASAFGSISVSVKTRSHICR
jgi:hypothetical protein